MSSPAPAPPTGAWFASRLTVHTRDIAAAIFLGWLTYLITRVANAYFEVAYAKELGLEPWVGFLVGFSGTTAAMAFWLASPSRFKAELKNIQEFETAGLSKEQVEYLRELAVAWYGARRFGGSPLKLPTTSNRPQTRKPKTETTPTKAENESKPE